MNSHITDDQISSVLRREGQSLVIDLERAHSLVTGPEPAAARELRRSLLSTQQNPMYRAQGLIGYFHTAIALVYERRLRPLGNRGIVFVDATDPVLDSPDLKVAFFPLYAIEDGDLAGGAHSAILDATRRYDATREVLYLVQIPTPSRWEIISYPINPFEQASAEQDVHEPEQGPKGRRPYVTGGRRTR